MNILIIGGTRFVGRHIAEALIAHGHNVTLFNRGTTAGVHADMEQVHGDRNSDLARLDGRTWDAVIDTCGYTPDVVEASARYLADLTQRYVFVSTLSVYDEHAESPNEDAQVLQLPANADASQYSDEYYGHLKVLCENAVRSVFGERATILRPGLVVGPFDYTDRFTYWPVRADAGGEILTPRPDRPIQFIDARDLAQFAVRVCEQHITGTFNCVTPPGSIRFAALIDACLAEASAEDAAVVSLSDEFLALHNVGPWIELPLWVPGAKEYANIATADSGRALAAGLTIRSLHDTVRDTLAWARTAEKHPGALKAGLSPEREAELLAAAKAAGALDSL
jgi:2'-hydroxyisoflavone reductase